MLGMGAAGSRLWCAAAATARGDAGGGGGSRSEGVEVPTMCVSGGGRSEAVKVPTEGRYACGGQVEAS